MKKINKKNIIILIILIIIIIIEINVFTNSRANKLIEITVDIIDSGSLLSDEQFILQAINEGESGYSITLPSIINEKKVDNYLIEEKQIKESSTNVESVQEKNTETNNIENIQKLENNNTENRKKVKKNPGEKIYLTQEEINNKTTQLTATYDKKENDGKVLYSKYIETTINDNIIKVEGYMPKDAKVDVKLANQEEVEKATQKFLNEKTTLKIAYDIKIISDEKYYEPIDFDENVKITICGLKGQTEENKTYKIIHINDKNEVEEIQNLTIKENELIFPAKEFSTYALLEENTAEEPDGSQPIDENSPIATYSTKAAIIHTQTAWDGSSIATGFAFGSGTKEEPYLICDGEELAYLAQQVNNGNLYEGQYFQIVSDIDLGNKTWTPIGNTSNSFRGILDGAGHTIANAAIQVNELPDKTYDSYGLFGSIGGGNSRTIIRNLELSEINIDITASGATGSWSGQDAEGIHIGCMTGSMYKNSSILNVIAKSSSITDSNAITVYDSDFQLAVGGIVGFITNTSNSNTDPGANSRYSIENCFSNVMIDLDATARFSTSWFSSTNGRSQYHTGGIVGTIRSQPAWPTNCLYSGTISSNGFIGPIFAALVNNTDVSSHENFATIWNGNDAGNLTVNNAYYTSFSASGTTFTQSITSGNSTARKNNTTTNVGYIQGVNKGIYTTNMTTVLTMFNNNVSTTNQYVDWFYTDGIFSFKERLTTTVDEPIDYNFEIQVNDPYNIGNYTYRWYRDGKEDTSLTGTTYVWTPNYEKDEEISVITSDGDYYAVSKFTIKKIGVDIVFDIRKTSNSVVASLEGEGLRYTTVADYTFQWYQEDLSGEVTIIDGATSLKLTNLEEGMDYKLIATNTKIPQLSTENQFTYGDRTVIYVKYSGGNNNNNGFTPETPVQSLSTAYSKLDSNGSRNKNVIVIMGTYSNTSYMNNATATTYKKNVTITGKYKGKDYNGQLYFYSGTSSYRYLTADTTFQYLTFYGGNNQMYFYLQGHSLTMGEGLVMNNYATANSNQGLLGNRAPALHIICGWLRYNYAKLPQNNAVILIKSGTYGRIIGGGSPGTTGASNLQQTTSHNFMGSSMEDSFKIDITVDIKNSTTPSNYDYDINLLVGGSACGNNYSRVTENIKSGTVGRLLGGSIGDSSDRPNNWNYPINTFLGESTINITGGSIAELYGGCLGRNMNALSGSSNIICDSYFYGTVTINMSGGEVTKNIYGAGAGGVTGYSTNSSDNYKSYGQPFNTSVNLNLSGGTVLGNIYGGGYGYTEYLTEEVTATDSGSLYGKSNITIINSPTIKGNIYAAGCGYNLSSKPNLAQFEGNTNIDISGSPQISGQIFGGGAGINGYANMAKLTGTSNIKIAANLDVEVYGGGNIAQTQGSTIINIGSGNHTANIYGGGNVGIINGNTTVNINGGTQNTIFAGGNQASVTNSTININDGNTNEIFTGGNQASVDTTNTYLKGGTVSTIYGGSNQSGTVKTSNIETTGGTANIIYGGNNVGGTTEKTNVLINGGSITESIYGGGNQVDTNETNITLQSANNTIPNVYGGGNQAGVQNTHIYCKGTNTQKVFGGSNTNGTVNTSNIDVTKGTFENIYGGNNKGGTTINTNIIISGGIINNLYGGGEKATSTTSNIKLNSGTIQNVYGGGNQAGLETSNIQAFGGEINNIFGGSNVSGNVENSYIITASETDVYSIIKAVYGGNNQGGQTNTTHVTINGENVLDVYGGGNQAITNETNLQINGIVQGKVFGGGNQAGVNTDTNVTITDATITDNVYGGGDEGTVGDNTYVHVKNSNLKNSLYAGGNGTTAIVYGNTNLVMEGTSNKVTNSVFGGGNKAATGEEDKKTSISTVNIAGGTIGKNVYGGANTSVVYGTTQTNIGYDTIGDNLLEIGNIEIGGTVFGGGEANEAGDENYDFSFISVTNGINIKINGNGHSILTIKGSIFGSGNASSTSGESYIDIQNYGTSDSPQSNISIQRANCATISNSAISLSGATDRTNEFSSTYFSLSRVDEVKLKNNSILYLSNGANLLKKLDSIVDENGVEVKGKVTINPDTGENTKNVDNRIYMLEGKNLNIATNEQVTAYGQVSGMIFLGLFTNKMNPSTSTGFYHQSYKNGETITNAGTFSSNSYAMAEHMPEHDTTKDGFYSNYNEEGIIRTNYIEISPKDDVYYIWLVGEKMDVTTFEISLTASKYATLGTYELSLKGFSDSNMKFSISGFSAGLENGVSLVEPENIEAIAQDQEVANNVYGLSMKTGNIGWQTKGSTTFLTKNGGTYTGINDYDSDNSTYTPTLNFCFYHFENISLERELGDVKIRLQVLTPIDDLNYKISYIDINVKLSTALYQDDFYEAAITPGQEFGLFTTTETTITSKSAFSTYYSLYIEDFSNSKYYKDYKSYKRVLTSRDSNSMPYVFPVNTKLTMLDMVTNKYYYYIVTPEDVATNKYVYALSDFVAMGSNDGKFNEETAYDNYYNTEQNLIYENFIFHINFEDTNIENNIISNSLLMELRDTDNQILVGVLGIQRDTMVYSVYPNKDATIELSGTIEPQTLYLGNSGNLNIITHFTQTVVNSKTVYDTQYFDKKLGIKISLYDNYGNRLNSDGLMGVSFNLDGKLYYPRVDGTTRINIAGKVTNVLAKIKMNTQNNKTLATGDYKIRIESFGSSDGIYYGLIASDMIELDLRIINSAFGLKVRTDDTAKIINKDTGSTLNNNNSLVSIIDYSSGLLNPNIAVSLYRREYTEVFSQQYNLVDFKDYVTNPLVATKREKEYKVSDNPLETSTQFWTLKPNLITGTYKLVYKLYDGDVYVGEAYEYMVVK